MSGVGGVLQDKNDVLLRHWGLIKGRAAKDLPRGLSEPLKRFLWTRVRFRLPEIQHVVL